MSTDEASAPITDAVNTRPAHRERRPRVSRNSSTSGQTR